MHTFEKRLEMHEPQDSSELIRSYFYQITVGCQRMTCSNPFCAINPDIHKVTDPNRAALVTSRMALDHFTNAKLCGYIPASLV